MKEIAVSILNQVGLFTQRYLKACFHYDFLKYRTYSGLCRCNASVIEAEIRIICHTIEKALSLSDCRDDFGRQKIENLLKKMTIYKKLGSPDPTTLDLATSILKIYVQHRKNNGLETDFIPNDILQSDSKTRVGAQDFLISSDSLLFPAIASARHSIRNFSHRMVNENDIKDAVSIAQSAPSACNRQATRIYACVDPNKISIIKQAHGGIRTFGSPGVIFAIAQDLNFYINEYERNTWLIDAGIFCMNMLYALQSVGIGACPVIWGGMKDEDNRMASLLGIPANERIGVLIVAGYPPKEGCKTPCSSKRPIDTILKIIR